MDRLSASRSPLSRPIVPAVVAAGLFAMAGATGIRADEDIVPRGHERFEALQLEAMPPFKARRLADGRYEQLTRAQVVAELREITGLGLNERGRDLMPADEPRITCRYEFYSALDEGWFKAFSRWFERTVDQLDLGYRRESWDCDDYSQMLNAMADLAMLRAKEHPAPQLIGRMVVRQNQAWGGVPVTGLHELVVFRSGTSWRVLEPQTGEMEELSDYPNRGTIREILFN